MSENPVEKEIKTNNAEVKAAMSKISRRSFVWAGIASLGAFGGIHWLASRLEDSGTAWPFRRTLDFNEGLAMDYFGPTRLAPTFPREQAEDIRANGDIGLDDQNFDPDSWKLTVNNVFDHDGALELTLDDIKKLPKVTQVTEFCCIEGWSTKVEWTGVRFLDFVEKYPPNPVQGDKPDVRQKPTDLPQYVAMLTPDEQYYVGLDLASAIHPQTLLCYEMNGKPLTSEHGAPLRLVIPVKYGVKNLKRIGTITYATHKPADYWAEQGYDWYAGL